MTLDQLLDELKSAVKAKEKAEHARVKAEEKKRKAHYQYLLLQDIFRAKEFTIK